MKNNKIKILISAMTLALLGLITLQIFWSIKTIEMEEVRFDATINRVLSNVVLNLEKDRTANVLIEKVGGGKNSLIWVEDKITLNDSNKVVFLSSNIEQHEILIDGQQLEINVEVSNKTDDKKIKEKSEVRIIKKYTKVDEHDKHIKMTKIDTLHFNKKHLIKEVLEDMTSFKKENYFISELDESSVDSLIGIELIENGLETEYYFGVINKEKKEYLIIKSGANKQDLNNSRYSKPLSPNDIFSNSLFLKLHIPNTFKLALKSIWIMFALSLLFIFIIIFVYVKTVKMFLEQKKVAEVKNDLINNITHEFKTPISAISLASEALTEPKLFEQKDAVNRYSKIIGEENQKLAQLVETLLNTAAFEKSEIELNLEVTEVGSVIFDLIEKAKVRNNSINIAFDDNTNDTSKIKIDIFHFSNIINNLIDNAIKYSKDEINISVKIEHVKDGIEISIADKGIGITKSDQQKIFDTFFRVQTGNIHNVKGNGIGLSYAKRIVEAHNGTIKVVSKLNFGSTFIIFLPYEK